MFRVLEPRSRRIAAAVAVLALSAAACSGAADGLTGVRDPDRQMFFEVPADWSVYLPEDLGENRPTPFVAQGVEFNLPVVSRVVFTGTSDTGTEILGVPLAEAGVPVGSAVVRSISQIQRDQISRFLLSQLVVPYQNGSFRESIKQDIEVAPDFEGIQVEVVFADDEQSPPAAVSFISVTNPAVDRMYSIAVGCSFDCFVENRDLITGIIDSWLVNTR